MTRLCTCDRFHSGRAYVAGRDCAKCWLFAHRPAVRKAWGGDPADCDRLYAARPDMTAAECADLLAGPPLFLPDDWRTWPQMREAHILLVDRFLDSLPPYPVGRFAGRGAILCGGGSYEAGAYVACRMLRHVGWNHPIQVWHRGAAEPVSMRVRSLPGVEVVDAEAHVARPSRRFLVGWGTKAFAILHCPFEEILFLDADCYPICDPNVCFDPAHNPHGIVTWPDCAAGDQTPQWATYGLEPDGKTAINGGHYVFTKRRAWVVLQLAAHFDDHCDYYYCRTPNCTGDIGGYGDQDQMRVAIHRLGAPSHRYADRPLACAYSSYIQPGPHGRPLFVHRHYNKLAPPWQFPLPPRWLPGHLPMEATAWHYFLEWLMAPAADRCFPDEVPGWFSQAECRLWSEMCQDRNVLELGRHHGRSTIVAAASARKVVSIDRESEHAADLWLQRYGVRHKVWLRQGQFAELAPTSGGPFSACLIDGSHDRLNVEADISAILAHLCPGAVIGFHDYGDPAHPDVQPVVDSAAERFNWRPVGRADFLAVFATADQAV